MIIFVFLNFFITIGKLSENLPKIAKRKGVCTNVALGGKFINPNSRLLSITYNQADLIINYKQL